MTRPKICKRIGANPSVTFYKPQGIPLKKLKIIELNLEEWESLRLKNIEGFNQTQSAEEMQISQSTFQRILTNAQKKISTAIIQGCAIKIQKEKAEKNEN